MRKDLKIGMAIGAVLLAVLVVYFAMPKPGGSEFAGTDVGGAAIATDDEDTASAEPVAGDDRQDRQAEPGPIPPADAQKPDVFAQGGDADADADSDDNVAARNGGGTNWAKLLDDGGGTLLPPLRTTTPAVAARGNGATDAAVPAAGVTSSGLGASTAAQRGDAAEVSDASGPGSDSPDLTDSLGQSKTGAVTTLRPGISSPTADPQPEQAAVDPPGRYTIKAGDNYSTIAQSKYGSSRHYLAIERANPDLDATRIRPGTVINLPDPATLKGSDAPAVAKALDPEAEYEVQPNDSLYKIAVNRYGSSKMTDDLYELNKEAIGPDPKRLKLGMILKLPAKPKRDEPVTR